MVELTGYAVIAVAWVGLSVFLWWAIFPKPSEVPNDDDNEG